MDQRDFEQKYRPFAQTEIPCIGGGKIVLSGISVREYMATHILQGVLSSEEGAKHTLDGCVEIAIRATDILQQKLSEQLSKDIRETDFEPPYNPYPIKNDSK
jgi:hypothetical protein